jgi:hypothetical protein
MGIKGAKAFAYGLLGHKIWKEQNLDDMPGASVWMASESENRGRDCTNLVSPIYRDQILHRSYREDCSAAVANEISAM